MTAAICLQQSAQSGHEQSACKSFHLSGNNSMLCVLHSSNNSVGSDLVSRAER